MGDSEKTPSGAGTSVTYQSRYAKQGSNEVVVAVPSYQAEGEQNNGKTRCLC